MIGTMLGHCRVTAKLGAGGMGEVYRARDERLDRDVAIKVLPAEVAGAPDRLARFEREAKALARLSHPNILAIHEFGQCEDVSYAVTELLEGETLRERLREGPLPWRRAVELGAAIADGVAAAHAQGIVHRDLKPENVFLTQDGRVKVLDFGLARVTQPGLLGQETLASPPSLTEAGALLGTVGYMSPEQVRGLPADHRSDVFGLGCLLFEMLVGRAPFLRHTGVETMTAILKEEPPEISVSVTAVTPELNRIVARCLEKSPAQRFQSAADLAFALRAMATVSTPAPRLAGRSRRRLVLGVLCAAAVLAVGVILVRSSPWRAHRAPPALAARRVVVVPFENNTGDPALAPLSRMASDWITQGLSRIDGLEVVPSTSVMFAERTTGGKPVNHLAELAARTGAGLVVTGACYRQGTSLQVQASITDLTHGKLVAALEPAVGDASAPMAVIDAMRQRVLGAVAVSVGPHNELGMELRPPLYEAYREFILGFELFVRDDDAAIRHFERAVAIDPSFRTPLLYAAYLWYVSGQYVRVEATLRELSEHRSELAPLGRRWLDGFAAYTQHRYAEALRELIEIDRLAPRDPMTVHWIGLLSLYTNEPRRTVESFAAFPGQPWGQHVIGDSWVSIHCDALHMLGEHERELAVAREAMAAHPEWVQARAGELAALAALGRVDEAVRGAEACLVDPDLTARAGDIVLATAKELRVHGSRDAAVRLSERAAAWYQARLGAADAEGRTVRRAAEALRQAGHWGESKALLERSGVLRDDDADDLGALGSIAAHQGDRRTALALSEALRQLKGPYLFGRNTYRRACISAALGDREEAVALLRQAIAEGAPHGLRIHVELDFESLREYPPFVELLRPKG